MIHENPQMAVPSPPADEEAETRAALLRLLDLLAERVAQKILQDVDAKDGQAT